MLFKRGFNAKQVQVWLGHHSPAFTLETYVHLLSDGLSETPFGGVESERGNPNENPRNRGSAACFARRRGGSLELDPGGDGRINFDARPDERTWTRQGQPNPIDQGRCGFREKRRSVDGMTARFANTRASRGSVDAEPTGHHASQLIRPDRPSRLDGR
jgi:hypothetical protein